MGNVVAFLGTVLIAVIGWAIRLESKVNVQDQKFDDLKELIEAKFDMIAQRLGRIETAMNGAFKSH